MLSEIKIGDVYYSRRNYCVKTLGFVADARRCWTKYIEYEMVDQTFDSVPGVKFVLPVTLFKLWFTEKEKTTPNPLGVTAVKRSIYNRETEIWFLVHDGTVHRPVAMLRYNEDPKVPVQTGLFELPGLEWTLAQLLMVPVHPYIRELRTKFLRLHPDHSNDTVVEFIRGQLHDLVLLSTRSERFNPLDESDWQEWRVEFPVNEDDNDFDLTGFQPVEAKELLRLELQHPEVSRLYRQIRIGEYLCEWDVYAAPRADGAF